MHRRTSRSIVTIALASSLVVGLAACGGDPDSSDGPAPPVPVRVVAGASGGSNEGARLAADGAAVSDMAAEDLSILPWFGGFEYVVDPALGALPSDSTAYRFSPGASVDQASVERLAAALGVEGSAARGDPSEGVAWRVGADDGTAPGLVVLADPFVSWYYSGTWALDGGPDRIAEAAPAVDAEPPTPVGDVEPTKPVGDGDTAVGPRESYDPPTPPDGVPDAATAEGLVRDILAMSPVDADAWEFESFADEWSAAVTAWQPLGAARSPATWSFGFGGDSELHWAGGAFAVPEELGPYPLVDLDTALARLADQQSMWGPTTVVQDIGVAATDDVGGSGAGAESSTGSEGPDEVVDPALPVDPPMPDEAPEPETAVLVDIRPDLWWAWDGDGMVWMLPAYAFTDTEGRVHLVPAVTDEYLVVDPPTSIGDPVEPMPVEPPITDPGEPMPGPTEPPAIEPPVADPGEPVPPFDLDELVGMEPAEADDLAAPVGWSIRTVRVDGEWLAVTDDFRDTRINVEVDDGVVTVVVGIG